MPFTPFHWGTPLLINEILFTKSTTKKRIQLITLIGSSVPDIEGFMVIVFILLRRQPINPIHGSLHSITGAILEGLTITVLAIVFTTYYKKQEMTRLEAMVYFVTPLLFHIVPDMLMYPDMPLFWPFSQKNNPYTIAGSGIYLYILGAITLVLYLLTTLLTMTKEEVFRQL